MAAVCEANERKRSSSRRSCRCCGKVADADGCADRRAGRLLRTLDLRTLSRSDALRIAATDYSLAQALALAPPRGADGDRETRLRSQVKDPRAHLRARHRAWRVLLQFADQDETGQLRQRVARGRETTVSRMELMYRAELSTLPEEERRHC